MSSSAGSWKNIVSPRPPQPDVHPSQPPQFEFTAPYPIPEYDYPTSHKRTRSQEYLNKDSRSPSPTPSEIEEANVPFIDWKAHYSRENLRKPKTIITIVLVQIAIILTILIAVEHTKIENWLRPAANWMQSLKFGWLIPVAILFIISFPPLFGHEIVAVLCGDVWGLWKGFGIVVLGSMLGEIGNFYAFKYWCSARGEKFEREKWWYACLARTVRDGGFIIAVVARLSAIPGHFTTAVFATAGMNIFVFFIAALLSMPKQFVTVYIGVILNESGSTAQNNKSKLISDIVLGVSIFITIAAGWYILKKMRESRIKVVRDRRRRDAMKLESTSGGAHLPLTAGNDSTSTLGGLESGTHEGGAFGSRPFNPTASDVELANTYNPPLGIGNTGPQQWNAQKQAVAYNDPYAPSPSTSPSHYIPPPGPPPGAKRVPSPQEHAQLQPPTVFSRPPPLAAPQPMNPIRQTQFPVPDTTHSSPSLHPQPLSSVSGGSSGNSSYNSPLSSPAQRFEDAMPNPFNDQDRTPSYTRPTFHTPPPHPDDVPQSPFADHHAVPPPRRGYQLSDHPVDNDNDELR